MGQCACLSCLFVCLPLFCSDRILTILTMMGISVISVHGLNILTGYCGQISIGHAGFMAVGGYTSAIFVRQARCPLLGGAPLWCPGRRYSRFDLRPPFLEDQGLLPIMATIAAHFIIIWAVIQLHSITGGADGLSVPRAR